MGISSIPAGTVFATQRSPASMRIELGARTVGSPKGYADEATARVALTPLTGESKPAVAIVADANRLFGRSVDARGTTQLDPADNPAFAYDVDEQLPQPGDDPLSVVFEPGPVRGILDGTRYLHNDTGTSEVGSTPDGDDGLGSAI